MLVRYNIFFKLENHHALASAPRASDCSVLPRPQSHLVNWTYINIYVPACERAFNAFRDIPNNTCTRARTQGNRSTTQTRRHKNHPSVVVDQLITIASHTSLAGAYAFNAYGQYSHAHTLTRHVNTTPARASARAHMTRRQCDVM